MYFEIPSVFVRKKLFKTFITELSLAKTSSFSNKIIFIWVKETVTVLQKILLSVIFIRT